MSTFTYGAKPKVVSTTNDRFGNRRHNNTTSNDTIAVANNIMHDARVLRGSTYNLQHRKNMNAPNVAGATGPYRPQVTNPHLHQPSTSKFSNSSVSQHSNVHSGRSVTPPPLDGRVHATVQTDTYLHDLRIKTVKVDSETQTLNELDVPAPRLFKPFEPIFFPRNCYKDASINTDTEELYDFDLHVEPVLDILVESALTNALYEVLEEQELKNVDSRDQTYSHNVKFHEANVDKLEQHAERLENERLASIENRNVAIKQDMEIQHIQKLRSLTRQNIEEIGQYTYDRLVDSGYFYEPLQRQVVYDFMPALIETVTDHITVHNQADEEVSGMIRSIFKHALVQHAESYKQLHAHVQEKSAMDAEKIVSYLENHQEMIAKRLAEQLQEDVVDPEEDMEEVEIDETSVIELHESDEEDVIEEKQALLLARAELQEKRRVKAALLEEERILKEAKDKEEAEFKHQLHKDRVAKQAKVLSKGYLLIDSHKYIEQEHVLGKEEHSHSLGEQPQYVVFQEKPHSNKDTLTWMKTQRMKSNVSSLFKNSNSAVVSNDSNNHHHSETMEKEVEEIPADIIPNNQKPEEHVLVSENNEDAVIDEQNEDPVIDEQNEDPVIDEQNEDVSNSSLIDPSLLEDMRNVQGKIDENILNQAILEHEYGLDGE